MAADQTPAVTPAEGRLFFQVKKVPCEIRTRVYDIETETVKDVTILIGRTGIGIGIAGYGEPEAVENSPDATPLYFEIVAGEPRAVIWPDINNADPTIVSLAGAAESLRKPDSAQP